MLDLIDYLKDRLEGKAPSGARRDKRWREVRKKYLRDNPQCEFCGSTKGLQIHHVFPFHLFPDLELDPDNLMTLCTKGKRGMRSCHFFAHLGDWKNFNPKIKEDARIWRNRFGWQKEEKNK